MKNSALVVIDLQDDITKHYREIIDPVNAAIDWAVRPYADLENPAQKMKDQLFLTE